MEEIILQNEAKSDTLCEFIEQDFLPQVKEKLNNTHHYLTQQMTDYNNMENESDGLLVQLMDKKQAWSKNFKQLSDKNQKETELIKRVEDYKKAKKTDLVNKQKTIDSLSIAMKEACSKVKPELLAKINPLPETLQRTFQGLFFILYDIPQEKFAWDDFKKKALLFERGEDFQSRLANFNFKGVPPNKLEILQMIQADQELEKLLEDIKFTQALIDLAEWVTFAVNGIKFTKEKDELQNEYDKICRDFDARGKDLQNTEKSQAFWENSFKYVDDQITFLNNLCSVLKGVQNDVSNSNKNLDKFIGDFITQTNEINKLADLPKF